MTMLIVLSTSTFRIIGKELKQKPMTLSVQSGMKCVSQVLLHLVPASPRMCWGEVEVNIVAVKSTARLGWGGLSGTGGGWDGGRPSPAWHWPGCCHLLQSPLMVSAGCDQSPDCSLLRPSATPHTSAADIPATSNTTPLRSAETLQ